MNRTGGYNEAMLDGEKLADWLKDVANNVDSLLRMEIKLIDSD